MALNPVDNCIKYDISDTLQVSTFLCMECDSLYYLNSNVCLIRASLDINCLVYDPNNDKCL